MKNKIIKEINQKEYKSNKEIAIELIKLAPKGVFFDPLDCILLDEHMDCDLTTTYYKLLKKLFGNNAVVVRYLNENWDFENKKNFWNTIRR